MAENKEILEMTRDEFVGLQRNVIKKAVYKKKGRPAVIEPVQPSDRVLCGVCGKTFTRSGRTGHQRTVFHQERLRINKKLTELLL